jgi:putative restriction endonuclease
MRLLVAVTDNEWYWQLRSRPLQDEVNFWQPGGGRSFQALRTSELLLFKPHTPHHSIVGGGFFLHASELPCSLAWEYFQHGNGATGLWEMHRRIERFRHLGPDAHRDYDIGCIVLQRPFFFDEADWIPVPADFSKNVGQGKTYDTSTPAGLALWEAIRLRLQAARPGDGTESQTRMFEEPTIVQPSLGAGSFRLLIADIYERRCAITREATLPALEAAHIRPLAEGGSHRVDNGILLRSDLRRLFDLGYLSIDSDNKVLVSKALDRDYGGANAYSGLADTEIHLPERPEQRPRRESIDWHRSQLFRT